MLPLAAALLACRRQASLRARLALALVLFAAGLAVRLLLLPRAGLALAPFYPVVLAAFVLAGSGPGALCAALSLIAGGLLLPGGPAMSSLAPEAVLFSAVSAVMGVLVHLLHAQGDAELAQDQACRAALSEQDRRMEAQRQRYEEALAAGKREIEFLYEQAPCGYHALAADGTILAMNRTALDWLGVTREDAIGRPIADFFTDEGRAQFAANFPQFLRPGHVRNLEFELRARDGTRRIVQLSAHAVGNADGSVAASHSVMQDITDLRRTRLALVEHQQRLRAVSQVPLPIALLRRSDCVVLEANRAFFALVGYSEEELLGRSPVALGVWADLAQFQSMLAQVEASGTLRDFPMRFRRRSGLAGTAACSCTPVRRDGVDCLLTAMLDLATQAPAASAPETSRMDHIPSRS